MTPGRLLAIASVERTGSTLLCSILRQTGVAGNPLEYLNIRSVNFDRFRHEHGLPRLGVLARPLALARRAAGRPEWRDISSFSRSSWRKYLVLNAELNTSPNGLFGVKMHWQQYSHHMLELGIDVTLWARDVRWVRITRDDEVRQAISFVRAAQTRSWNSNMAATGEPVYDPDAIRTALARIRWENVRWDEHLAAIGADPLRISFEQLVSDREATVRAVLAHAGTSIDTVPAPGTRTQSDSVNDEWAERFAAEPDVDR